MITRKPTRPYVVVLHKSHTRPKNGAVFGLVSSVATKTSVSEARVRSLLREGKIEGMKVGSVWLANRDAVRSYKKERDKATR